jgi:hypothetical protein
MHASRETIDVLDSWVKSGKVPVYGKVSHRLPYK